VITALRGERRIGFTLTVKNALTGWAYNREPFRSTTWTSVMNPLDYWKAVAKDSNASVLGVIFFLSRESSS
jgi:hypothetical protein